MKNIKAIIFDAYGTLFDVNSAAEKCKDKIGDKWEGFANYWRTTQLEYTWLRSLMKRHKDFWQVTEDSLDKSMKAYEIDSSMRNELLDLYKILSPFKEVPEVLKSLKEKDFKLAILSNGTPTLLNELVKINKERLEKVIIEAAEQSNRITVPSIEEPQKLKSFLNYDMDLIFTDLNTANTKIDLSKLTTKPTCVIIGPVP